MASNQCEDCQYFAYDEDYDEYMCEMDMDEDEYARLLQSGENKCPYYRNGNEYLITRKQ